MKIFPLKVTSVEGIETCSNVIYFSPDFAKSIRALGDYIQIVAIESKSSAPLSIYSFDEHPNIKEGYCGVGSLLRRILFFRLNEPVEITPFQSKSEPACISKIVVDVDFKMKKLADDMKADSIIKVFQRDFSKQYLSIGQEVVANVDGYILSFRAKQMEVVDLGTFLSNKQDLTPKNAQRGIFQPNSFVFLEKREGSEINLNGANGEKSQNSASVNFFKPDFNFEDIGIGGLDKEFHTIFRRAFAPRVFSPQLIKQLGSDYVKGILLYGPPGTGKTLMARQIGRMLNSREPKLVNGPEILNKFVGQSEENVRNLFAEAEKEWKEKKENSRLHIIIFDEIDAICKKRGSRNDGTGVGDSIVNQLLSKIDGVNALNNVLIIGMTNRIDLLDEAIMRPNRLEVLIEIGLPDEMGRVQILNIHTKSMKEHKLLSDDVDIPNLAARTLNFTGAELKGLVRSATSYALIRHVSVESGVHVDEGVISVTQADLESALREVNPAFGKSTNELNNCMINGIIHYGSSIAEFLEEGSLFVEQVKRSAHTPLVTVLLEGPSGSGKTALAAKIALDGAFPFTKIINAENMVMFHEQEKCNQIVKVFDDAYKSETSCIVIDEVERLLDYVRVGPRFSNAILQTLFVCLRRQPPQGRRLLVFVTTSSLQVLHDLSLISVFDPNTILTVPLVNNQEEFAAVLKEMHIFQDDAESLTKAIQAFKKPLPIKKLILAIEQSKTVGSRQAVLARFCRIVDMHSRI